MMCCTLPITLNCFIFCGIRGYCPVINCIEYTESSCTEYRFFLNDFFCSPTQNIFDGRCTNLENEKDLKNWEIFVVLAWLKQARMKERNCSSLEQVQEKEEALTTYYFNLRRRRLASLLCLLAVVRLKQVFVNSG